jgi:hypothetical protein
LMNFSQCLKSGRVDCANALIKQGNIAKLTNFHLSTLFAREIFLVRTDFCTTDIESARDLSRTRLFEAELESLKKTNF